MTERQSVELLRKAMVSAIQIAQEQGITREQIRDTFEEIVKRVRLNLPAEPDELTLNDLIPKRGSRDFLPEFALLADDDAEERDRKDAEYRARPHNNPWVEERKPKS